MAMIQGVSIGEMLNQSITVLTNPSVATFERFEKHGGLREGLIYVALAAAISGVAAFVFGLLNSIGAALIGLVGGILLPVLSFFIFGFLLAWMSKQQGGTGTADEVYYTVSLYSAPILAINGVLGNIPLINCLYFPVSILLGLYQAYLAYVATRASMNLGQQPAIIAVVVAILAQWLLSFLLVFMVGLVAAAVGVATGAIQAQ